MARPTLRDVADRAGVSVSTVSYALNAASTLPLADATKMRVRRIAHELGYVPNGLARSLRAQASRTIGVVLGKPLTSPRYAAIAEGLARGLRDGGFRLTLVDEPSAPSSVDEVRGGRLDGLVFIGHDDQVVPATLAEAVRTHEVPFVAVDCGAADAEGSYSAVDFDYGAGVRQVFGRLASDGIRSVLYVRPDLESPAETSRAMAIAEQERAHPELTVCTIRTGVTADVLALLDVDADERRRRVIDLQARVGVALSTVDSHRDATAVVCAWGADVEAAYRAARSHDPGVRVAALAAGALTADLWPGLSYSRLPLEEAGRESARLIITRISGSDTPEHVVLTPSLLSND